MAKQIIVFVLIACFTLAVFAERTPSRMRIPPTGPDPKSLHGLTDEEASEVTKKWFAERRLHNRKVSHENLRLMVKEAWKNELRVSERQWRIIEPKHEREKLISETTRARAHCGIKSSQHFNWTKATEDRGGGFEPPKTPAELTEGEKIISELIDLVRQENPSDEELRSKIDALQKVREEARKEWPKARRELAAVLTTPRQEAVFLVMGRID